MGQAREPVDEVELLGVALRKSLRRRLVDVALPRRAVLWVETSTHSPVRGL